MNVSLTPELEKWIQDKVQSGLYSSSSEVVRGAVRILHQLEEEILRKLSMLKPEIQILRISSASCIIMKRILILLFALNAHCLASDFDGNALWIRGKPTLEKIKETNPNATIEELEIKDGEEWWLLVSYRSPTMDEANESTVSFSFSVTDPSGEVVTSDRILAGQGNIQEAQNEAWAVSKGGVAIGYDQSDERGTYRFVVRILDEVSKSTINQATEVILK